MSETSFLGSLWNNFLTWFQTEPINYREQNKKKKKETLPKLRVLFEKPANYNDLEKFKKRLKRILPNNTIEITKTRLIHLKNILCNFNYLRFEKEQHMIIRDTLSQHDIIITDIQYKSLEKILEKKNLTITEICRSLVEEKLCQTQTELETFLTDICSVEYTFILTDTDVVDITRCVISYPVNMTKIRLNFDDNNYIRYLNIYRLVLDLILKSTTANSYKQINMNKRKWIEMYSDSGIEDNSELNEIICRVIPDLKIDDKTSELKPGNQKSITMQQVLLYRRVAIEVISEKIYYSLLPVSPALKLIEPQLNRDIVNKIHKEYLERREITLLYSIKYVLFAHFTSKFMLSSNDGQSFKSLLFKDAGAISYKYDQIIY